MGHRFESCRECHDKTFVPLVPCCASHSNLCCVVCLKIMLTIG
ncbi:hypothetical protein [Rubritalea tangerina]